MKKIFVIVALTFVSFQAFSLDEIRYFTPNQIYQIIHSSLKFNPHIKNINLVYPGDVYSYVIDGTIVTLIVAPGDNLTSILQKGIPEGYIESCKLIESSFEVTPVSNPAPVVKKEEYKPIIDHDSLPLAIGTMGIMIGFILFAMFVFKNKKQN